MDVTIEVSPLKAEDYADRVVLAEGYKTFYKTEVTDDELSRTWTRILENTEIFGAGAKIDGKLVGIVHYLFHATIWAPDACYLQDLFTLPESRGKGIASQLVQYVADQTIHRGADRLYWTTQEDNATARSLYDKIASYNGFIRYEFALHK